MRVNAARNSFDLRCSVASPESRTQWEVLFRYDFWIFFFFEVEMKDEENKEQTRV